MAEPAVVVPAAQPPAAEPTAAEPTAAEPTATKSAEAVPPVNAKTIDGIRYVRIRSVNQSIHIQEIEVYDGTSQNIAKDATVSASSSCHDGDPTMITNGTKNDDQAWPNGCHTEKNGEQHVLLDFGKGVNVSKIVVYNRPDGCQERLQGATVECFKAECKREELALKWVCSAGRTQTFTLEDGTKTDEGMDAYVNCNKALFEQGFYAETTTPADIQGALDKLNAVDRLKQIRFVRIRHSWEHIHVQEIAVWDRKGNNVATRATVTASSTQHGAINAMVVDGGKDSNQKWPNGCHTGNGPSEWVELDLGKPVDVFKVQVYNRPDCCSERLKLAVLELRATKTGPVKMEYTLDKSRRQDFGHLIEPNEFKTPLHLLAMNEVKLKDEAYFAVVNSEIGGMAMTAYDKNGGTPLLYALATKTSVPRVRSFLSNRTIGLDVAEYKITALHMAYQGEYDLAFIEEIYNMRKEAADIVSADGQRPIEMEKTLKGNLTSLTKKCSIELVNHVLAVLPDAINTRHHVSQNTPLHQAIEVGCTIDIVSSLTTAENIVQTNKSHDLPIHTALRRAATLCEVHLVHDNVCIGVNQENAISFARAVGKATHFDVVEIVYLEGNSVALKSANGKYLSVSDGEAMEWAQSSVGDAQRFDMEQPDKGDNFSNIPSDSFTFRTCRGTFLTVVNKTSLVHKSFPEITKNQMFSTVNIAAAIVETLLKVKEKEQLEPFNANNEMPMHIALMSKLPFRDVQKIVERTKAIKPDVLSEPFSGFIPGYKNRVGDQVVLKAEKHGLPARKRMCIMWGPDGDGDCKLKDWSTGAEYGSQYFKTSDFVQYLAGGTILHALLALSGFDKAYFKNVLEEHKELAKVGSFFEEYPIDTAKRLGHDQSVQSELWKYSLKDVLSAVKNGLWEETIRILEEVEASAASAVANTTDYSSYTQALLLCVEKENEKNANVKLLQKIQRKLITVYPGALNDIPTERDHFKLRSKIIAQANRIDGTRKLGDILKRVVEGTSVHRNMRRWFDRAVLSLFIGDKSMSECTLTKQKKYKTTCRQYSTYGFKGFLFKRGKIFYECTVDKLGRSPQIGWVDETFAMYDCYKGVGVGDDKKGWGADGKRRQSWNGSNSPAIRDLVWSDGDVVGFAIDLDSPKTSFRVGVNGNWKWVIYDDMQFSGGFMPAITHDGAYTVNMGESPMQYPPEMEGYRSVVNAMQHQTRLEEIVAYCAQKSSLDPSEAKIAEEDKILFCDASEVEWEKGKSKLVRLKPSRAYKLSNYHIGEVREAENSDGGISFEGELHKSISEDDLEVAISGTVLHYIVAEGHYDIAAVKASLKSYPQGVKEKDGAGRRPIDVTADIESVSDEVKLCIWQQMDPSIATLETALKAGLWNIAEERFNEWEEQGTLKYNLEKRHPKTENRAIHLAAKYGAPKRIMERIIKACDADGNLEHSEMYKLGDDDWTVLHYIAYGNGPIDTVDYILSVDKDARLLTKTTKMENWTPLHVAAAYRANPTLLARILTRHEEAGGEEGKAPLRLLPDSNNFMPLHWAVHVDSRVAARETTDQESIAIVKILSNTMGEYVYDARCTVKDERNVAYSCTAVQLALRSNQATKEVIVQLIRDEETIPTAPSSPSSKNKVKANQEKEGSKGTQEAMTMHIAARYCTSKDIIELIGKFFKQEIAKKDQEGRYPIHWAARSNRETDVVSKLLELEEEYHAGKKEKWDADDKNKDGSEYIEPGRKVTEPDEKGMLPLHLACQSEAAPITLIKLLLKAYDQRSEATEKCGGADQLTQKKELPLQLAIGMENSRSPSVYTDIILLLIDTYRDGIHPKQEASLGMVSTAISPFKMLFANQLRMKKLGIAVVQRMVKFFDETSNELPSGLDLSTYFVVNEDVFQKACTCFVQIFKGSETKPEKWGTGLPCTHPHLFKGSGLVNTEDLNKWKFWFVVHCAVYEGVERLKCDVGDTKYGMEKMVKVYGRACERDPDFAKFNVLDTPLRNILSQFVGQPSSDDPKLKWLHEILAHDPVDVDGRPKDGHYPKYVSPLAYAVIHGSPEAVGPLSRGGCNPVSNAFPKVEVNGVESWNISPYELANCAGANITLSEQDSARWVKAREDMRAAPAAQSYMSRKALQRLFTFRKLPLEIITIVLMVIVGALTTTGFDSQQLRFDNHITDKFIDEEFDQSDAHVRKTFFDIATVEEFWQWANGPLAGGLYPDTEKIDDVSSIVGSIRIRQVRAKPGKCKNSIGVPERALPSVGCLKDFVDGQNDIQTEPFGPGNKYIYHYDNNEMVEYKVSGDRYWNYKYRKGGYHVYLPGNNATRGIEMLKELQADEFISVKNGTRLILIDFNIFNPNIDRVVSLRLMVEFWVGGGAHSNVDTIILEWTAPDDLMGYALAAIILLAIFMLRLMYEIDEISWGNLLSIAKQVEFGDAAAIYGDTLSKRANYATLKSKGFKVGKSDKPGQPKYSWRPVRCCKSRAVAHANDTEKNFAKLRHRVKGIAAFKMSNTYGNAGVGPFRESTNATHGGRRRCNDMWAGIQTELFVLSHYFPFLGLHLVWQLTKVNKNDESVLGKTHRYHGSPFTMWYSALTRNPYFRSGWNLYEWVLVWLYLGYVYIEYYRIEVYGKEARGRVIQILDDNSDEFLALDRLGWFTTQAQDIVAIVFILVCIHLLRIMQEIPYGVGARVMAILRVLFHRDIRPFYVTLLIMIISFAVGIHFLFANEIVEYRNFSASLFNVLFASFGDFGIGIDEMMDSAEALTYVTILLLILFVSLIMMNIFIGVVGVVYEENEEVAIVEFDIVLDEYLVGVMDEDSKKWALNALAKDFQENLSRSASVDESQNSIDNKRLSSMEDRQKEMSAMLQKIVNAIES
jgi:hypothetical protein